MNQFGFGSLLALVCGSCLSGGCSLMKPDAGAIERGFNSGLTEIVKPAVEKLSAELSARTAQVQGQGSLINPGYTIKGFASAGPATTFELTMTAVGVSANLAAAGQADAGQEATVPPPALRPVINPATGQPFTDPEGNVLLAPAGSAVVGEVVRVPGN